MAEATENKSGFLEKFAADLRAFWRASSARQNARNAKLP